MRPAPLSGTRQAFWIDRRTYTTMNFIDKALDVHARALDVRSRRVEVLARNIANADTPHYKAQDIDFRSVLNNVRQDPMVATQKAHFNQADPESPNGVMYRIPFNVSFDGNTVELNIEQAQYGKAAADYQATLQFIEQRVSSIRKALKGE
jgi:flagellar basal-body rod protein FlgB